MTLAVFAMSIKDTPGSLYHSHSPNHRIFQFLIGTVGMLKTLTPFGQIQDAHCEKAYFKPHLFYTFPILIHICVFIIKENNVLRKNTFYNNNKFNNYMIMYMSPYLYEMDVQQIHWPPGPPIWTYLNMLVRLVHKRQPEGHPDLVDEWEVLTQCYCPLYSKLNSH